MHEKIYLNRNPQTSLCCSGVSGGSSDFPDWSPQEVNATDTMKNNKTFRIGHEKSCGIQEINESSCLVERGGSRATIQKKTLFEFASEISRNLFSGLVIFLQLKREPDQLFFSDKHGGHFPFRVQK